MSWYEKKVIYLAYYEGEEKKKSAGFAELYRQKEGLILKLRLSEGWEERREKAPFFFLTETEAIELGILPFGDGRGKVEKLFPLKEDKLLIREREIEEQELTGIQILLGGEQKIAGFLCQSRQSCRREPVSVTHIHEEPAAGEEPSGERSEVFMQAKEGQKPCPVYSASTDKWEELQHHYPVLHPFGDERVFIKVELKDFVIFHSSCQKLVNNSFLLHSFYNYRYLILGQDKALGKEGEECFYLGVPGTYFEREKMVAVMFGFEGFECEGPVQIGKFGYYMRRVEL